MALTKKKPKVIQAEEVETLVELFIRKIKENFRWTLCIVAAFCIIGVIFWGYLKYSQSQNEQAAYAYYLIVKELSSSGTNPDKLEKDILDFLKNYNNHPLSVLVRLELVRMDVDNKNWERAIKEGEAGLQKLPPSSPLRPFFLRYLAIAYGEQKYSDRAINYWDELARIAPEEWKREIYWRKGLILAAEGKIEEATASWREALKANGVFPTEDLIRERINSKHKSESASSADSK
ncbi:MAG: YfgM family protein [Thermodesulforhabdaceae bacterium]